MSRYHAKIVVALTYFDDSTTLRSAVSEANGASLNACLVTFSWHSHNQVTWQPDPLKCVIGLAENGIVMLVRGGDTLE